MQGLGISPFEVQNVIGVVKCYMTRVGSGPFFTEQHGDIGTKLQDIGGEIGMSFPGDLFLIFNLSRVARSNTEIVNLNYSFTEL